MQSAITLAQVPEAAAGPFVFHDPLRRGNPSCRSQFGTMTLAVIQA